MKAAPGISPSYGNGNNKKNLLRTRTVAAAFVVIAASGLLGACGSSGSGSPDDGSVASNAVDGKSLHGRNATGPNGSGDALPETGADSTVAGSPGAGTSAQAVTKPAPQAPAPVATINSVDTIINDMRLMNDAQLAGVPSSNGWARGPGHVIMGNDPRGTNTPSWWVVNNSYYKSGAYWNAILPWFVIFDGVGNGASNTRVQVRNMKLYMKSKASGAWKLLEATTGVGGELYPKTLTGTNTSAPNTRTESDGSTSVLPPGGNLVFHGWSAGFSKIDGSDVAAVFLTVQARLVKDNEAGVDDRAQAQYLIHVGGDYYPDTSTRASDLAPAYYFPGIGLSRAKLVTDNWQAFSFSTINVGVEDPGGATLTEAELRANPPPLE
jgi:hypothetical protein